MLGQPLRSGHGASTLLGRLRSGEEEAARELASRHLGTLWEIAHIRLGAQNRLRDDLESQDVAQEAALRICSSRSGFQGESESQFLAWASRIVESVIVDVARRRATLKRGEERAAENVEPQVFDAAFGSEPTPSEVAMGGEAAERCFTALGSLSDRYRRVIVLRNQCGCSFSEIASELDLSSEAQARSLLARALRMLSERMTDVPQGH